MTAPRAREQRRPPSPPDRLPSSPYTYAASAADRPAGFARLAGARRGLVRPARALAAAALLVLTGALALPATAQAQTATTLVSNVDKASNNYYVNALASQRFTTGSNPSGYILTGVDIVSATTTALTIELCETDTSGGPTSTCTELTPPSMFAMGTMSYTVAAGTTLPLTQDTTYSVKTEIYSEGGHGFTNEDGEDAADGWSIADTLDTYDELTSSWTPLTTLSGQALRIAIKGTVVGGGTTDPPTLSSARVRSNGVNLDLTFSENLHGLALVLTDADAILDAFTLTVDDVERDIPEYCDVSTECAEHELAIHDLPGPDRRRPLRQAGCRRRHRGQRR